jgi:hypothetical protein
MTQFEVFGLDAQGHPIQTDPGPLADPAKPLPPEKPLGAAAPPSLIADLPCKCYEELPFNCPVKIEIPQDCQLKK